MKRPAVDIVGYASIDRIEPPDGSAYDAIGGAAIYAALSAVRLGVTPRLCMAVGADFPEGWLVRLGAMGIDVSWVERRPGPTRRTRLVYGRDEERKNSAERSKDWWEGTLALAPPLPTGAGICLLCPLPPERVADMRAAAPGVLIADTSEAFAVRGASALTCFRGVDVLAPSLDEAALLTGESDETRILLRLSEVAPRIILKRGARGLLDWQGGVRHTHAPVPCKAVDPTGAGDASMGAIAAAIALGQGVEDQLNAGAAAGSNVVQGPGPDALGWRPEDRV